MATDPNGNNLYVADDGFGLAVYTIGDDGTLTFLANTPISASGAGQIQGIAAYPPRSCTVTDLSVSISAPTTVNVTAGAQSISYVITVANKGAAASSFTLTDNLTLGLFTKASCTAGPGATCDKGAGLKRQITFTLAAGQSGSVTVGATTGTSSVFFNGDILSNTAFISHASTTDSNPADNSATSNITVTAPIVAGKLTAAAATGPYFGTTTLQATLTRAAPVVAAVGKTITFSVNGTVMGTAVTDANGVASLPISLGGLNAGTYTGGISATFAADAQLLTTIASSTLTITKVPLTVTPTDVAKFYGDPNPAFPYTLSGFVNNETTAVVSGTAACTANASAVTQVGTSVISCASGTLAAQNYSFVFNKGTLTINPAPLVMAGTDASRLYGDVNPPIGGTLVGLKNADQASATFAVTTVSTSPVGVYPIIGTLVPGKSFTATNYTVSSSGNLTITPAPLTATATSASRVYGDPNPAFTGTITGLKNGDAVTATFTSTATAASPVGTYPITATVTGAAATNYSVIPGAGTLTITPASLNVSAGNATRLYGDANPVLAGTITGLKNGDAITANYASVDATSPVGTYSTTATLVDPAGKLGNYTVTSSNGTLTITPAPLSVVTANLSRIYGDANPVFTATITGLKNADNITASFSTTATAASAVGTYPILATLSDPTAKLGNYTVTSNNGLLTVTAAPLSVSAANASRVYGDPNPVFTGTVTGLKNGDAITASFAGAASAASTVGSYPIVPALADPDGKLANYAVSSSNGTLTVTPASLSVSAADATRVYGDPNPAFTGTITGLKNADNITATFASAATTAGSNVGTYPIVATLADPAGKLGNYTVTSSNGTLTVTKAPLSVSAANATRVYGDPNPVLAGTVTGLKNGDNITATYASVDATAAVGTYSITPTLVDPAGKLINYTVSSTNGNLTITPAPLSVTTANATRIYGDINPIFTATIAGLKNADNITASFTTSATAASSVGTYSIVVSLGDPGTKLGNYTVKSINGTLTITAAGLSVASANASRVYGDANSVFTGTITGLKNADAITATYASTAVATSAKGTYAIVPTVSDPTGKLTNYTLTVNNGTLTVAAARLSVTGANATRVYGDANPAFTGTVTGLKNADPITASYVSAAVIGSPVGPYAIVATLADPSGLLGNYSVTVKNGTLTVSKAPLSVVADNASRFFGQANPAFTGTITGLKNGDVVTAAFDSAATTASAVGTYAIVPALADPAAKLGNYAVTSKSAVFTVNGPVQGVSVTPNGGTSASATFQYTFSSQNGVGDIKTLFLQTATISAYPSSCGMMYDAIHNQLFLVKDDASGWLGPITPGAATTLSNSQCTVGGTGSSVVPTASNIVIVVPITFAPAYGGAKNIFMRGINLAGIDSGWQQKGTWTPNALAVAPTVASVTPNTGAGSTQTFQYSYTDVNGFRDVRTAFANINTSSNYPGSCAIMFDAPSNGIFLVKDDASGWLGPIKLGSASTLQNSQCSISGSASSVTGLGNNLTLNVAYTFAPTYIGTKNIFARAINLVGIDSGWILKGTWTTASPQAVPPTVNSVTPNAGSGLSQTFALSVSDVNGVTDLSQVFFQVHNSTAYPNGCAVRYDQAANRLYLVNDTGSAWLGPIVPGSATTLANSQCQLNGASSGVVRSGTDLTLNVSLTFAATYSGTKNVYGRASNVGAFDSNWQPKGTWTTQ
jgi:hypothetical protein